MPVFNASIDRPPPARRANDTPCRSTPPRWRPGRPPARAAAALLLLGITLLGACATDANRVQGAVSTPLTDLNLVQAPIPEVLRAAQRQPYKPPEAAAQDPGGCAAMAAQVKELDAVLGPDLDAPATDSNPGLLERGGTLAGNEAVGALQRTAEGVVPFRGWVRKLTGAERYSRQVAAAITAGAARRAFLKGLMAGRGCA